MKKIAVVYWSGTGNTAAMAEAVVKGAQAAGASAALLNAAQFHESMLDTLDALALGCPAMGNETLEDGEFEPMFQSCKGRLSSKAVALFGSYGWGDGEWMRTWEDECSAAGIKLACPSVICPEAPDDAAIAACKALGQALAD